MSRTGTWTGCTIVCALAGVPSRNCGTNVKLNPSNTGLASAPHLHGPANLFAPVPGDHGAHGRFDDNARSRDLIAPIATVLGGAGVQAAIAAGVTALGTALVAASSRWIARRSS